MNPTDEVKKYVASQIGDVMNKNRFQLNDQYALSNLQVSLDKKLRPQGFQVTVEQGNQSLTFKTNIHGQEVAFQYKMKW